MRVLALVFIATLTTFLVRQMASTAHALNVHLRNVFQHKLRSFSLEVAGSRMIVADHLGMEALRLRHELQLRRSLVQVMHRILMRHSVVAGGSVTSELNIVRVAREHRVTVALARVHLGSVVTLNGWELLQRHLNATLDEDAVQHVSLVISHVHVIRVF